MLGSYELLKQGDSDTRSPARSRRHVVNVLLVLSAITLFAYYAIPSLSSLNRPEDPTGQSSLDTFDETLKQCAAGTPPPATAPAPVNLWAPLTIRETVDITKWLESPSQGLNLTRSDLADTSDNFIFLIEAYRPSKAAALTYLEDPVNRSPPTRYARVTIHHGSDKEPSVRDYLVGPLPINEEISSMRPLTEIYHRDTVPYNARGYTDLNEIARTLGEFMVPLSEVTQASQRSPRLTDQHLNKL